VEIAKIADEKVLQVPLPRSRGPDMHCPPVFSRSFISLALVACGQERSEPAPAPRAIEVRDARGEVTARVVPGHPCRATVEGVELLVGGRPLIAQYGSARWTGEDAENGTTFKSDGKPVARIHARQLFDGEGIPILRVLPDGGIANAANQVVRKATATPTGVTVGDLTVTGTDDVVLAAMLGAREASPEVRALAACHFLLPHAQEAP
jgi:hypothetical protein